MDGMGHFYSTVRTYLTLLDIVKLPTPAGIHVWCAKAAQHLLKLPLLMANLDHFRHSDATKIM